MALDVALASKMILAHFWDNAGVYEEKPPLQLHASFDAVQQLFTFSFGDSCPKVKTRATDDKRITVSSIILICQCHAYVSASDV